MPVRKRRLPACATATRPLPSLLLNWKTALLQTQRSWNPCGSRMKMMRMTLTRQLLHSQKPSMSQMRTLNGNWPRFENWNEGSGPWRNESPVWSVTWAGSWAENDLYLAEYECVASSTLFALQRLFRMQDGAVAANRLVRRPITVSAHPGILPWSPSLRTRRPNTNREQEASFLDLGHAGPDFDHATLPRSRSGAAAAVREYLWAIPSMFITYGIIQAPARLATLLGLRPCTSFLAFEILICSDYVSRF